MTDEHLRFLEDTTAIYAGIGLQSMDPQVLKSVQRKFDETRFERVVREVGSIVPEATVELMMGLPGDNPDNFKRTLDKVRKLPVNVRVFHTLVLPDALMRRAPADFELVYDPFDLRILSSRGWSRQAIEDTCRWLDEQMSDAADEPPGTWRFFRPDRADDHGRGGHGSTYGTTSTELTSSPSRAEAARDVAVLPGMPQAVEREAAAAGWIVRQVSGVGGDVGRGVLVAAEAPNCSVVLRAVPHDPSRRSYRDQDGIAYSYERADGFDKAALRAFDTLIDRLHPLLRATVLGLHKDTEPGSVTLPQAK